MQELSLEVQQHDHEVSREYSRDIVTEFKDENSLFTSLTGETREEKAKLYNAMSNPDEALSDHVGEVIMLKDVVAHYVDMESDTEKDENGNPLVNQAPRLVLIADDGTSYACVSSGVFQALKTIFRIVGAPTYTDPLPVKVLQKKGRKGYKFLTVEIAY